MLVAKNTLLDGNLTLNLKASQNPKRFFQINSFTLLEFLVASFLSLLLLLLLYQAFGQTAQYFRKKDLQPLIFWEPTLFREQLLFLRDAPLFFKGRYLLLPLRESLGYWWIVYDLKEGLYAEIPGINPPQELENLSWFREAGLKELKILLPEAGELQPWNLAQGLPKKKPFLMEVSFLSGNKLSILLP